MGVRPIIFSTPMVRAILDGNKTVTRRVIKPQPRKMLSGNLYFNGHPESLILQYAPYRVGDTLWVRETWMEINGGVVHKANPDALEGVFTLLRGFYAYSSVKSCDFQQFRKNQEQGVFPADTKSTVFFGNRALRNFRRN